MKQIFKEKELIGKTIDKICKSGSGSELWLKFTDNSFVVIESSEESEGFGQSYKVIRINDWERDNTNHELVQLGLITRSEHEYAREKEDREYELRRQQRETENQQHEIERELQLLEELKKKYE